MQPFVTQAVFEDSGLFLMGRGLGPLAAPFLQADIDTIQLKVFEKGRPAVEIHSESPAVSGTVFNSLQLDARWTKDAVGYNFRYSVPVAALPNGNSVYVFEFKFTPTAPFAALVFHGVFEVPTLDLHRS